MVRLEIGDGVGDAASFLRLKAAELARLAEEARHPASAAELRDLATLFLQRAEWLERGGAGTAPQRTVRHRAFRRGGLTALGAAELSAISASSARAPESED